MSTANAAEAIASATFTDLALADFLKETIRTVGYETPTPIQAQAIPLVLEGHDLIGLAQTGTGKTAAFVLPLINKLSGSKEKGVRALILAPTRELAEQINEVIALFTPRTGLRSCTVYGGVSHRNQINTLRTQPAIVVACPGRLKDHIQGRTIDLSHVEALVLDEADRMLDMGFLPDIKQIVRKIPAERQTLLFSATMPDEIQELTHQILKDPKIVKVKTESPVATVSHSMYSVKNEDKLESLRTWLTANPSALAVVFTKMKHTAKKLSERLEKIGIDATSLHGNLSQSQRSRALSGFKDGTFRVMIATDIAARGIDVEGITHVVNYDMPDTLDAYIHRTGRAGRASRSGEAVSFVTRGDMGMLRSIERWLKAPVTRLNTAAIEASAEGTEGGEMEPLEDSSPRQGRRGRTEGRGRSEGRGQRRPRGDRPQGRERRFGGRPQRSERPARREETPVEGGAPSEENFGNREGAAERMSFASEASRENGRGGRRFGGRGRFERSGPRSDRPYRGDRPQRGGRGFGRARPEGAADGEPRRFDRSERPQRGERFERSARPERGDRSERAPRWNGGEGAERGGRPQRRDSRFGGEKRGFSRDGERSRGPRAPGETRGEGRSEQRFGQRDRKPMDRESGERSSGRPGGRSGFGGRGFRKSGPRSSGPRSSGPRSSGPRSSGPRSSGPRGGGAREAGPRGGRRFDGAASRPPRVTPYD